MKLEPNKKYKFIDDDLINGSYVLTGKQLNKLIEKAYKDVMRSKKWPLNTFIEPMTNHPLRGLRKVIENTWDF